MTAPAPPAPNPHDELATRIGTQITQELWKLLPEIAAALGPMMLDHAMFQATVAFRQSPEGIQVDVTTEKDIPKVPDPTPLPLHLGWIGEKMAVLPEQPQGHASPPPPPPMQPPPPGAVPTARPASATAPPQHPFPGSRPRLADEVGID